MGWFLERLTAGGGTVAEKTHLLGDEVWIGRSKESDLLCISIHVSRCHAKIIFRNGHPFIMDLGSANGTFINKTQIEAKSECQLLKGDTIGLGFPEPSKKPDCYVYRILRDTEDESSSSRTTFISCSSPLNSPPRPAADEAGPGRLINENPALPKTSTAVKRPVIEIIDLSDDDDRQFKKIKPNIKETRTSVISSDSKRSGKRGRGGSSTKATDLNDGNLSSSSSDDVKVTETSFKLQKHSSEKQNSKKHHEKHIPDQPSCEKQSLNTHTPDKPDPGNHSSEKQNSKKHHEKHIPDRHSCEKQSLNTHTPDKPDPDNHSSEKQNCKKHHEKHIPDQPSCEKQSLKTHNREKHNSDKRNSEKHNTEKRGADEHHFEKHKSEKNNCDKPNFGNLGSEGRNSEKKTVSVDHPPKHTSQSIDISIDDVFLMRSNTENEKSTVLATTTMESDRSDAPRLNFSRLPERAQKLSHSLSSTSKGFFHGNEKISKSKCRNDRLNSENSKSMELSDFGRSLDDPSSDSSRLVIDEDVSGPSKHEMSTPTSSLLNPRISSLIKDKLALATSTPHSKPGGSVPTNTSKEPFTATMSPITSRNDDRASPLMDFDEVKEKAVEMKIEPSTNVNYTLDDDVIVLSDDGEDFPNSQLFNDERPGSSRDKSDSDREDNEKPFVEEDEERIHVASPPLEDSDSDSDSVDIFWMKKLSQSQSFVKTELDDEYREVPEPEEVLEPEKVPEPVDVAKPEEVLEPEKVPEPIDVAEPEEVLEPEKVPEPVEVAEPEEPPQPEEPPERRSVSDAAAPVSPAVSVVPTKPGTSVASASRRGARRLTVGPEVIDAPPMPMRRAHLRGISVETAIFLQDNLHNKERSRSADRGKKREKAPNRVVARERKVVNKASAKEERKARLREISERKKAETSIAASKSDKKKTAKVKVTEKLRGSFLTEMEDSTDSATRAKVPTRQSVLKMKQIPKLKKAVSTSSHTASPLEGLNQTFERYEKKKNGIPALGDLPTSATLKPILPVAPRVVVSPPIPEAAAVRSFEPPAPSPARALRSCLRNPTRKEAVYVAGLPRKKVTFREEKLVEVKIIEAISTTRPSNQAKDAPFPTYSLAPHLRALAPDINIDTALKDIFQWNAKWLDEYLRIKDANPHNVPEDPPAQGLRPICALPSEFVSYDEYFDKMYPLLLLELWNAVVKEWEILRERRKPVTHFVAIDQVVEDPEFVYVTCHALYHNEHECPKLGDLVVCEFVATSSPNIVGSAPSTSVAIDCFGYVSSENRDRHAKNDNEMLLIKNPSAKNVVRLTVQLKNRNVQIAKDKLMKLKVVKYIRPELRYFQALKYFKNLSICTSILSPKADSSAFDVPPLKPSEEKGLVIQVDLNASQEKAILKTTKACFLLEPKICVIQGPPGTGKSRLISCLVMQLLYGVVSYDRKNRERGIIPRILLCAASNSAVDVLVMKLLEGRKMLPRGERFKMVRVGRLESMHPQVRDISLETLAKKDVHSQGNMDSSSAETELHMYEAKLRASEHALEASRASGGRRDTRVNEDGIRELKRKIAVLQNRLDEGRNFEPQRSATVNHAAEREASKRLLIGADIVATTLSSCFTKIMENVFLPRSNGRYNFSCCIIDEATQCMEVQTLTPLMLGVKTLVLVGDPKQLPATVLSQNARNCGLARSLFGRVLPSLPRAVHFLDTQYRMHPDIASWPNRYFYQGLLRTPDDMIDRRISPLSPYCVMRTPFRQDSDRREVNTEEAKFVITLAAVVVQKLLDELVSKEHQLSVGIITPYQKQKQLLISLLQERYPQNQNLRDSVDINTFDSFQGQEKDVVIMSCVRTDKIGFLNDPQRLNVALTRAKFSLLICGNFEALYGDEMWSNLLQDAQSRRRVKDVRRNMSERELCSLVAH